MGAMTFSKIEKIIFDLAEPIAEENGLYIYDVEFIKEGGHWFLRVYLDKPEEDAEIPRAVQHGGFLDVRGDALDVGAHDDHVEKLKAVTSVNSRRLEFLASIGAL